MPDAPLLVSEGALSGKPPSPKARWTGVSVGFWGGEFLLSLTVWKNSSLGIAVIYRSLYK